MLNNITTLKSGLEITERHWKCADGVPQGSVLGPLLFLVCINDISNVSPDCIGLFADDTNVFIFSKNIVSAFCSANRVVAQLNDLFVANKLSLSIDKTCYSIFGCNVDLVQNYCVKLNNNPLNMVTKSKYLGITIDNELSWQCHIDDIYTKLLKFTSILYTLRHKVSTVVLRMLYFAFVHPHFLLWC